MTELSVFVPTRGRPANAAELARAFHDTCTRWTELVLLVDDNDPDLENYAKIDDPYARIVVQPAPKRRGMVEPLNRAVFVECRGWAVGFMGDDHRPRTEGWDDVLLSVLEDAPVGIAWGDDLWQHDRIPTHVVMPLAMVDAVGYMSPPELEHLYVDRVWKDWGVALKRCLYRPEIVVEHVHPDAGKAEWDDNYRAVNAADLASRDKAAYERYRATRLSEDVRKFRRLT